MITHNDDNIDKFLDENTRVIILFGATWCSPCKTFKPKFQKICDDNPDIVFAYCDVEETRAVATDLNIQSVPAVVGFFDGIEFESIAGANIDKVNVLVEKLRSKST